MEPFVMVATNERQAELFQRVLIVETHAGVKEDAVVKVRFSNEIQMVTNFRDGHIFDGGGRFFFDFGFVFGRSRGRHRFVLVDKNPYTICVNVCALMALFFFSRD